MTDTKGARAFIVNLGNQGLGNIREFVESVVPITDGQVNIFDLDGLGQQIQGVFRNSEYRPGVDKIALNGHITLNYLVGKTIQWMFPVFPVNILLWDAVNRKYIERTI